MSSGAWASLAEVLQERAATAPESRAYTFLLEGEMEADHLTYAELDRAARAIAAILQDRGLAGSRVVLLYPPGLEFVAAFFGCLYAGVVAVPSSLPRGTRNLPRLRAILAAARPRALLTTGALLPRLTRWLAGDAAAQGLFYLATDEVDAASGGGWKAPARDPRGLAFLQFTSGSTSSPKGVMVSHGNLLHNCAYIQGVEENGPDSVGATWLPSFHDMGLIEAILQPLYSGYPCYVMSPSSFLQRPYRWLEVLDRYRVTNSGAPNFAYDLCVERTTPEQREALDLRAWRVAYCGAEPVRKATLERFAAAFAPAGFRWNAFYPVYGLAEATLVVSSGRQVDPPAICSLSAAGLERGEVVAVPPVEPGGRDLVGCGRVGYGMDVAIVEPSTLLRCPPDTVGEIWIQGPSVTQGYWNLAAETAATFGARLADSGAGPYLRTGDLGFLRGDQLFVTGRLKDLVILRGRNHYPQDLEATVEAAHPALRRAGGAAFSVETAGEERLVVVQELEPRSREDDAFLDEIAEAVQAALAAEHEVRMEDLVLIRAGTLPKTSSGKVQRAACRTLYLSGGLEVVGRRRSAEVPEGDIFSSAEIRQILPGLPAAERAAALERVLAEGIAAALHLAADRLDPAAPLSSLGLDSLQAAELAARLADLLGIQVSQSDLLRDLTVRDLALAAAGRIGGAAGGELLERAPERTENPMSSGQEGLFFLARLAPESAAYHLTLAARVLGDLDEAALERALHRLAARHSLLRTAFLDQGGRLVLRTLPAADLTLGRLDLSALPPADFMEAILAELERPFDLAAPPPLRTLLATGEGGERLFLLAIHHIVSDLWSLAVFMGELDRLYREESEGAPAGLEPLEVEYGDYARWQQRRLAGAEGERSRAYWERQLAGASPALDLPADRPRPKVPTFRGDRRIRRLDRDALEALGAVGRARGATFYATLAAAFAVLLHRLTGQEDLTFGVPTANRPLPELARMIGYFTNPVVLRARPAAGTPFLTLLDEMKEEVVTALEHAEMPLSQLAEHLRVSGSAGAELFQVMFLWLSEQLVREDMGPFAVGMEGGRLPLGSAQLQSVEHPWRWSQFDFTLTLAPLNDGFGALLEYSAELFDRATAHRLLDQLESVLAGLAAEPGAPIGQLSLLGAEERHQVLFEWAAPAAGSASPPVSVHSLFEAQAQRTPEAEAIVGEGERLTYRELDLRADRLARRLRFLGVGTDQRVAICLERTPALVVALLAALKAGGAYVPLDPSYPEDRLAFMLADSGARVGLTHGRLRPHLAGEGIAWLHVEDLESPEALEAEQASGGRGFFGAPDSLAYVIYTSGSTGKPKGVAVSHRSVAGLLHWSRAAFDDGELSGLLASTSVSFDVSVFEIFSPLSWGGRVILARDALELPALAAAASVRTVATVPSAAAELVRSGGFPAEVRTVALAGEPLGRALVDQLFAAGIGRVLNIYGPTEATVYASWESQEPGTAGAPGLGRSVAETWLYVLDPQLAPVPPGVPGELCLAGPGVARGYLGRPELTAERFLPDPHAVLRGASGERIYRTGDRVRRRAGGELEYLGRLDHQVKIRGFRIELGEVEAALVRLPEVESAVVVARREEPAGDLRLVAYLVPRAGRGLELRVAGLREALRRELPESMIPAAFVVLDALPLTPNGKLDRRALPAPRWGAGEDAGRAPEGALEEVIAVLWCEMLGLDQVGAEQSFFSLGGHSLSATRLIARLRQSLGVELSLRDFFEAPSVARLAQRVEAVRRSAAAVPPPLVRGEGAGEAPLSFAQRRLWLLHQLEPESPAYNLAAALHLAGPVHGGVLAVALAEIVRRHQVLRTAFPAVAGEPVQRVLSEPGGAGSPPLLPRVSLGALPAALRRRERDRLAAEEARRPFDLASGRLLRAALLDLGEGEHALLLNQHHIASDGWSLGVFGRELAALYASLTAAPGSREAATILPELPLQYADFARWQRRRFDREALAPVVAEARWPLTPLPPVLDLPTDRPRSVRRVGRGGRITRSFAGAPWDRLRAFCQQENATSFMALLAAFQVLLSRQTRQEDFAIGAPVAIRPAETEPLIGLFVNTLVLRADLTGEPDWRGLLSRVREQVLAAHLFRDLPFEVLVEELRPERSLYFTPVFQAFFSLLPDPLRDLALPGLGLTVESLWTGTAQFDLSLAFTTERGDLVGALEYDADLFDEVTVARLAARFEALLGSVGARPDTPLVQLDLLLEPEKHQVLVDWNDTAAPRPAWETIHQLFAWQAVQAPGAVAAVCGGSELTYGDLDLRAEGLAARLQGLGVAPEDRIGIHLDRSPELPVALLGVLKAGAAYVPLDTALPEERLAWMVEDAGVRLLLTRSQWRDHLPALPGVQVLCLDALPGPAGEPVARRVERARAQNFAYVIYTSGSTGRPKGVMVEHGALVQYTLLMAQKLGLRPDDRILQFASLGFDVVEEEVFPTWAAGGAVVFEPASLVLPGDEFSQLLAERGVTGLELPAAFWHQWVADLAAGYAELPPALRFILVGSERPLPERVAQWTALGLPLVHVFGLTETTITSTLYRLPAHAGGCELPIGRPLDNARIALLDGNLMPVPLGAVGDLWIGGAGLARGYWGRPDLTAERFLPDPFTPGGERLYRTGDLARFRPDGLIDFLGRRDDQVKVRGVRVELAEIEAALGAHPAVAAAAVVARPDGAGSHTLVAYLAPREEGEGAGELSVEGLRAYLRRFLPEAVVPGRFVVLPALPLTASGKIDRRSLPADAEVLGLRPAEPSLGAPSPGSLLRAERDGDASPRTAMEEVLAEVWEEVLGRRVGIHDNFFAAGGDSILAIQVVARAQRRGVVLKQRQIFEEQTVAELARVAGLTPAPSPARPDAAPQGAAAGVDERFPLAGIDAEELPLVLARHGECDDVYPMTPMQEGMLFHALDEPGAGLYFGQLHGELRGDLLLGALEEAWRRVIDRHAALRTAFSWEGSSRPLQVVLPAPPFTVESRDWSGLPAAGQESAWQSFLDDDRRRGFDLGRPPLMRFSVIRLAERRYRFLWSHHQMAIDGWSLPVVFGEMLSLYGAARGGPMPRLDEPAPWRDYIAWRERQDTAAAERFWRRELEGFQTATPLPFEPPAERPRPGREQGALSGHLSAAASDALRRMAARSRLTLSTLAQGAWALLLARVSGEPEITFGVTTSGRPADLPGVESMVGVFINTLPVRVALPVAGAPSLVEWLQRLQAQQAEMRQFEHVPLAALQSWIGWPAGELLFKSFLVFQNYPIDEALRRPLAGNLEVGELAMREKANYPIALMVVPGRELAVEVEFDAGLFSESAMRRLLMQMFTLLEGIASATETLGSAPPPTPWDIPLLPAAERHMLLWEWNDSAAAWPSGDTVHGRFSLQALRTPTAPAVVWEDREISYREVEESANRLAHRLRQLGVGPESVVAVCTGRSPDLAVALLGTLKAGGAFLPLDPSHPAGRLEALIAEARARVLVTESGWAERLSGVTLPVVRLDGDAGSLAGYPASAPAAGAVPENLAYVLFTSGSTGRPKGVLVDHRSLFAYAWEAARQFGLGPGDRVLQFAAISFDVLEEELFPTWLSGGAVVFELPERMVDTRGLSAAIERHAVTGIELPAPFWQEWVRDLSAGQVQQPASLRWVLVGSEKPALERLVDWVGTGLPLLQVFGLTETTITTTVYPAVVPGRGDAVREPPIGRPIANAQVHVLGADGRPLPVGVSGELYIGGTGVARGYLERPELTAERFCPDPCGPAGERLYRTGDLARWRSDGNLEFLGRIDDQVKVRGFRIEPGEIEVVLDRHPSLERSLVLARTAAQGKRLVAYLIVAAGAAPPTPEELRAYLAERLPDYMVPAAFVTVPSFPLTAHGKIDRAKLPAPEADRSPEAAFVPPGTPIESLLAGIWEKVLGVSPVGVHDNFFTLGGDSILSIQVVSRTLRAGIHVTPRQLFEQPTVAGLAASLAADPGVERPAAAEAEEGEVPLSAIQRWFFEQELPDPHHWNMSLVLAVGRPLDTGRLAAALSALVGHHDALRLAFLRQEDGWRQLHAGSIAPPTVARACLARLPESRRGAALEEAGSQLQASLDLARPPLLRLALFELGQGVADRLLIVGHHLVLDGVSWRILLADLEAAYEALERGQVVRLGSPTMSFSRWTRLLAERAAAGAFDSQLAWWTAQRPPRWTPLPLDFPGGDNAEGSARVVPAALSAEATSRLLHEVPRAYRTGMNDALLAALARTVSRWTGDDCVLVELEGHGRAELSFTDVDLSRTVGWFTALFPVLLDLRGRPDPGAALLAVKEQLRRVPDGGIGYGLLRYCSPDEAVRETLRESPRPQILFEYAGQLDTALPETSPFALAADPAGPQAAPAGRRAHSIMVSATVEQGRLRMSWSYGERLHRRSTIERLAAGFVDELEALIAHCLSPGAGGVTPSDFPLASLRQEQLDRLVREHGEVEDVYPLAPLQEGMLFHSISQPASGVYLAQFGFELRGELNLPAFAGTWQQAVARHAALRTAFVWRELDRPAQVVRHAVELPVAVEDLRSLPPAAQREHLDAALRADREAGFALDRPPLMRVVLRRLADDRYDLTWTVHQMMLDGWSLPLLLGEILAGYEARSGGSPLALPPVAPYRNYISWVLRQDEAALETFWRGRLAGFTSPTGLETGRGAKLGGYGKPDYCDLRLTEEQSDALRGLARAFAVTPNVVLLAAWAVLVGRYNGASDVVFGTVVSGRPPELPGVESIVGLFINTVPVRVDLDPAIAVGRLLGRLQADQAARLPFDYTPLLQIQRWSEIPGGTALFETLLVFENYPMEEILAGRSGPLEVRATRVREQSNYPVNLVAVPGRELALELDFYSAFLDRAAAGRLLGHLSVLLDGMAAEPARPLASLSLLSTAEVEEVLAGWREEPIPLARHRTLDRLFARQVEERPDARALTFESQSLTYGELAARSNQLAHHLRALGVGPEVRVAVFLERCADLVITLLAVVKAGGAYVPIDLAYPPDRVAYLLADSAAAVLVSEDKLLAGLDTQGVPVLSLDGERAAILARSRLAPPITSTEGSTAYVIYTSGTTGRPKGVMIPHVNVLRLFGSLPEWFDFGPSDVWTLFHSVAFDFSVWEMWGALLHGGRLVVVPYWVSRSPEAYHRLLWQEHVTILNQTPTAFHSLASVDAERPDEPLAVRLTVLGAEALEPRNLRSWFARYGDSHPRLVNMYGITETTVITMHHLLSLADLAPDVGSVIGHQLLHLPVKVLDRYLQAQPVGVIGEIYVGGRGLATAYLGRPALTAERFIPDPWASEPGARLYRSGDLVRRLPRGVLEYIGRADHQVKLRGLRIETGEVEAALNAMPAIRESAVVLREAPPEPKRLVAYLVASGDGLPPVTELRAHLATVLPAYMVPAAFVWLERLPMTAHGKLDRRALPAPEAGQVDAETSSEPPRDELERQLAEIWADVLGLARVGRDDNFFELGGDSILSIQIVARAHQQSLQVTPRLLFEHPILADLAAHVRAVSEAPGDDREGEPVAGPVPLTPVQRWFFERELPEPHFWNQSLLLAVARPLDGGPLRRAVQAVLEHHDALRFRFHRMADLGWQQTATPPASAEVPVIEVDLSALGDDRLSAAIEAACASLQPSLDLGAGPLLRTALFSCGQGRPGRLLFIVHHLVVDGVSWRILLDDLATACRQAEAEEPPRLPRKATSFRSWARRLDEHARSSALLAEAEYWCEQVDAPAASLPLDFPAGENLEASTEVVTVALSEEDTEALLHEVPRAFNSQINDALLSGVARAISLWTGCSAVRIDLEGHGREEIFPGVDLSRTVGWFTTIFPVCFDLQGESSPSASLRQVKERLRQMPRRGIGYGLLRFLRGDRGLSLRLAGHGPSDVLFNYLGQLDQALPKDSPFSPARESSGHGASPLARRSHRIDVSASVTGRRLVLDWTYSRNLFRRESILEVAQACRETLEALARHAESVVVPEFTPSDFPEMDLNQAELDQLLAELGEVEESQP